MYTFLLVQCQQPIVLTIGGLLELNLNSCLQVSNK